MTTIDNFFNSNITNDNKNKYYDLNSNIYLDSSNLRDFSFFYMINSYTVNDSNCNKNKAKTTLILDIQERISGPSFFAFKYWDHIKKGGDPNVF